MLTLEQLRTELEPYHNHICLLYDTKLVRLLGIAEDDMDFYYVVKELGPSKEYWASAVGAIVSLKDIYPRYNAMENIFGYEGNNCLPSDEFLVQSLRSSTG